MKNIKVISKQMENEELDGEINDKEFLIEILNVSTIPFEYFSEDLKKIREIFDQSVKINGIVVAADVYKVIDKGLALEAI